MDVTKTENKAVKDEVLTRVDLMPNVSSANKDKLYQAVERARSMGKILTIPFASGKTELAAADIEALRTEMEKPELTALRDDADRRLRDSRLRRSEGRREEKHRLFRRRAPTPCSGRCATSSVSSISCTPSAWAARSCSTPRTWRKTGSSRFGRCCRESDAGMSGAHLAVTGGLPPRVFPLPEGSFIAGRSADTDFELSHVEISRQHCRFSWDGKSCTVEDLGSVRGTRVNGQRIEAVTTLQARRPDCDRPGGRRFRHRRSRRRADDRSGTPRATRADARSRQSPPTTSKSIVC